jgi:hypothetical protein
VAHEFVLGSSAPAPATVQVSTDRQYLGQRLTSYEAAWLGRWPVERIRKYRDGHEAGRVYQGKRLARVFRRDANVVAALGQRVAPWLGCKAELEGGDDALRAELAPKFGPLGGLLPSDILRDVAEDLAMCGIAVLHHPWKPRADGTRWEPQVEVWDLEAVDWDGYHNCYYAQTREWGRVPIRHGDGLWTIVRANQLAPHEHGAVIPLAIHVASRMSTVVDRNNGSRAVGMPKAIGILPEGVKVSSEEGRALETALDNMMQGLSKLVASKGTEIDKMEFNATGMGQFFGETIKLDRTDIFFALTGQDGSAQNAGGNYQKAQVLEAVLYAWVMADTVAGGTGITTGLLRPYASINRGDPDLAPFLSWPLPDPDEDARVDSQAKRHKAAAEIVKGHRDAGFDVTPEFVATLEVQLRIKLPPLALAGTTKELFAYHQRGGIFTKNEIRESRGYPTRPDGNVLVDEMAQPSPAEDPST